MTDKPLLEVTDLHVSFEKKSINGRTLGTVRAVDGVSFTINPGEILGLVGESGCGKTTIGQAIVGLNKPKAGTITLHSAKKDKDLVHNTMEYRRAVQIIFQDPYSALNPKRRISSILQESRIIQGFKNKADNRKRIAELITEMGFGQEALMKFPHQFSGGQLQRIGIARAILNDPELVICDEPVSALDVSIQSQILNLLADLQRERGYAYLFITHDLSVVRHIADRILVMYLGEIVEQLSPEELITAPKHPYTQMLSAAIPGRDDEKREQITIRGEIPSPLNVPVGCRFHTRCPFKMDVCEQRRPELITLENSHRQVRCHLYQEANSEITASSTRALGKES